MGRPSVGRASVIVIWIALWALVLVLDPGFGYLVDHPIALAAITVLPQVAIGYLVGGRAVLCVVPLAVAWALVVHADCAALTSADGECGVTASGFVGLAASWALIWGFLVAVGYGLRVGVARWAKQGSM
jgi:hypothetical protein